MSVSDTTLSRTYSMHRVNIEVETDDPAVGSTMDQRLRGFNGTRDPSDSILRFEFVSSPAAPLADEISRPVYETRYGSLRYVPGEDLLTGQLGGVALHCEPSKGRARIAAPTFSDRALYFATHPVATVALMELMERLGRFSLHAGCLADADGNGLLLAGPSGSGKSTLALALARAGMQFLGDDTLFLERVASAHGAIRVLGFADTVGLGEFAAQRFPELAPFTAAAPLAGFPKRLCRPEDLFGPAPTAVCSPRVIVFPEVTPDRHSTVTPLDPGEALLRLVPDVLVTNAESTEAHVAAIAALLSQVRCYSAASGKDLEHAAELIGALL